MSVSIRIYGLYGYRLRKKGTVWTVWTRVNPRQRGKTQGKSERDGKREREREDEALEKRTPTGNA